jgi:hypothetical protein
MSAIVSDSWRGARGGFFLGNSELKACLMNAALKIAATMMISAIVRRPSRTIVYMLDAM